MISGLGRVLSPDKLYLREYPNANAGMERADYKTYELIVVGAGTVGLSLALSLSPLKSLL